jgi:hypothetical protein
MDILGEAIALSQHNAKIILTFNAANTLLLFGGTLTFGAVAAGGIGVAGLMAAPALAGGAMAYAATNIAGLLGTGVFFGMLAALLVS